MGTAFEQNLTAGLVGTALDQKFDVGVGGDCVGPEFDGRLGFNCGLTLLPGAALLEPPRTTRRCADSTDGIAFVTVGAMAERLKAPVC